MKSEKLLLLFTQISSSLVVTSVLLGCDLLPTSQVPTVMKPANNVTVPATSTARFIQITPTFTEGPSATLTSAITATRISTPVGEDAISKLKYLVETNGHCSLPCWWGIAPGRTAWTEVNKLFEPIAISISPPELSNISNELKIQVVSFNDPIKLGGYWQVAVYVDRLGQKQDTIEIISAPTGRALPKLLADLGIPSEIWVNVNVFPGGEPLYKLVLCYDKGILLENVGRYTIDNNYQITICPTQFMPVDKFTYWLWDPTKFRTFEEIGVFGIIPPMVNDNYFRHLSEVGGIQPQDFYDTYIDPSATNCMKMPASEWP